MWPAEEAGAEDGVRLAFDERIEEHRPVVGVVLEVGVLHDDDIARARGERGETPKSLSAEAEEVIMAYDWPGNVRELENALERAVTLTKGDSIPRSAIPDKISERKAEPLVAERLHKNPPLEIIEQAYITWVLQSEGGNKTRAADVLGIDPSTLYRKLSRYGVEA